MIALTPVPLRFDHFPVGLLPEESSSHIHLCLKCKVTVDGPSSRSFPPPPPPPPTAAA